jgi:hypothetical protein
MNGVVAMRRDETKQGSKGDSVREDLWTAAVERRLSRVNWSKTERKMEG